MIHLIARLSADHQKTAAKAALVAAGLSAVFAALSFMTFTEKSETSGVLWWKVTRQLTYGERAPYLYSGLGLAALAAVLALVAAAIWVHPATRASRAQQRQEAQKLLFQTTTIEGRAQRAFELGDLGFAVTLRVDDGSHWRHLREVEAQGWRQTSQLLREKKRFTDVTPHGDGSHTVIRSSEQEATFYFERRAAT